jgi:hypothetical protein
MPTCGAASAIDVSDIEVAAAHADVQAAFAMGARFGDSALQDAPFTTVRRASNGATITVSPPCVSASATCKPTPAGVQAFFDVLYEVVSQQLADPTCAAFR